MMSTVGEVAHAASVDGLFAMPETLTNMPIIDACGDTTDATAQMFGWLGTVLAVLVFAAPIPTMLTIRRHGALGDFDSLPYVAMLMQGAFWTVYGLPIVTPCRTQVLVCNVIGVLISVSYVALFVAYADSVRRPRILAVSGGAAVIIVAVCSTALILDAVHPHAPNASGTASMIIGVACVVVTIAAFGAPLAIVRGFYGCRFRGLIPRLPSRLQ